VIAHRCPQNGSPKLNWGWDQRTRSTCYRRRTCGIGTTRIDLPDRSWCAKQRSEGGRFGLAIREHPFVQGGSALADVGLRGALRFVRVGEASPATFSPATHPPMPFPTNVRTEITTIVTLPPVPLPYSAISPLDNSESPSTPPTEVSPDETGDSLTRGYHQLVSPFEGTVGYYGFRT